MARNSCSARAMACQRLISASARLRFSICRENSIVEEGRTNGSGAKITPALSMSAGGSRGTEKEGEGLRAGEPSRRGVCTSTVSWALGVPGAPVAAGNALMDTPDTLLDWGMSTSIAWPESAPLAAPLTADWAGELLGEATSTTPLAPFVAFTSTSIAPPLAMLPVAALAASAADAEASSLARAALRCSARACLELIPRAPWTPLPEGASSCGESQSIDTSCLFKSQRVTA
jgi:hypothetical protein